MDFNTLLEIIRDDPLFDSSILLAGRVDPQAIRTQLSRWVNAAKIDQLRRGLYTVAPPFQKKQPHPFLVANHLQKASYVSLQSALSFYGLIPEVVHTTTSVTTGRPGRFETTLGDYQFRHTKTELLFGYQLIDLGGQSAFVATPEKALLDLIYLHPGGDSPAYLNELRLQNTERLDRDLLSNYAEAFKSPKMHRAVEQFFRLMSGKSEAFEDL